LYPEKTNSFPILFRFALHISGSSKLTTKQVGDGVHVWNPSGKLLGKIFVGTTSANFNFAGKGRMVICAETELYYATLAAEGSVVESELPPM
jgi:hypothetical protein